MLTLLKNADVYAPEHLGARDMLVGGGKILLMEPDLGCYAGLPGVQVHDLGGLAAVPGLVDAHVHITGGGGEQGFASRVPELALTDFTLNGVTTVLGLLGTDGTTRCQQAIVAKAGALNTEGITAFTLTGSYQYPSRTFSGSVTDDIMMLGPVVGVKVALSDHRSSSVTAAELARLGSEARLGGLLSGKPGIVILHMGGAPKGMNIVFEVLDEFDVSIGVFLPTHCGRSPLLVSQAEEFMRRGGMADFTASESEGGPNCAGHVSGLIKKGLQENVLISSDAGGSLPRFDAAGKCTGMGIGSMASLLMELRRMVNKFGIELSCALLPITKNPAKLLMAEGTKGCLAPGAHADILCLNKDLTINTLYAQGRLMVKDGAAVVRGMFG